MSKVILTQEQANIIEATSLDKLGEWFYKDDRKETRMYKLFCDFSIEELVKAKLIGDKVEPEFKAGDWVVIDYGEHGTNIGRIKGHIVEGYSFYIDHLNVGGNVENSRHATPEEIKVE